MLESDTYRAILDEGRLDEARDTVLRLGQKKFGPSSDDMVTALKGIEDRERLQHLQERLFDVSSWQELLHVP